MSDKKLKEFSIKNERHRDYMKRKNAEEQMIAEEKVLASNQQIGGSHYKDCAIQPIDFIMANNFGFCEGNIIKYTLTNTETDDWDAVILEKINEFVAMYILLKIFGSKSGRNVLNIK